MDASQSKDYVLVLLFVKYVSGQVATAIKRIAWRTMSGSASGASQHLTGPPSRVRGARGRLDP
jgi:hypothetical protein